jgi:peptidoglycan/LPS O-acetylase OafA/YrhL
VGEGIMKRAYIPTLNGWRAIAVLLVIGAHSYTMLHNSATTLGNFVASVLSHAGIGVDIFFGISGVLICTLLLQEKEIAGSINLPGRRDDITTTKAAEVGKTY